MRCLVQASLASSMEVSDLQPAASHTYARKLWNWKTLASCHVLSQFVEWFPPGLTCFLLALPYSLCVFFNRSCSLYRVTESVRKLFHSTYFISPHSSLIRMFVGENKWLEAFVALCGLIYPRIRSAGFPAQVAPFVCCWQECRARSEDPKSHCDSWHWQSFKLTVH